MAFGPQKSTGSRCLPSVTRNFPCPANPQSMFFHRKSRISNQTPPGSSPHESHGKRKILSQRIFPGKIQAVSRSLTAMCAILAHFLTSNFDFQTSFSNHFTASPSKQPVEKLRLIVSASGTGCPRRHESCDLKYTDHGSPPAQRTVDFQQAVRAAAQKLSEDFAARLQTPAEIQRRILRSGL